MAEQIQVQLRVPSAMVKSIDAKVAKGEFRSRSDAIKSMIRAFEEREKTRAFYQVLVSRSEEARKGNRVPLGRV